MMSLFEDLIEELKEENLIEETVIETFRAEQEGFSDKTPAPNIALIEDCFLSDEVLSVPEKTVEIPPLESKNFSAKELANQTEAGQKAQTRLDDSAIEEAQLRKTEENVAMPEPPPEEKDFYRRRATEEVTSLQIVEHILTGVEREQMKIPPKSHDDIPASLALHDFLKITSDANSSEHSLAEFKLMGETERWHSALSHRDKFISVGDLRRYCESTRPALSSQALAALARFYRNSPFSDAVRNKFDLIMTRLVTKELQNHTREILFERKELRQHLSDLYADWSSIPVYADDDDSEVLIASLKLEDFITEAEAAKTFEDLVAKDFFNRLRILKENTGANFFSPLVTATAIECNVIVGNRYVELIEAEHEKNNSEILEKKYNFLLDQPVSDATSKTLQLIELLKNKKEKVEENKEENKPKETEPKERIVPDVQRKSEAEVEVEKETPPVSPKANKQRLLLIMLLAVVLIGGLYFLINYFSASSSPVPAAKKVDLEESVFREYFKAARINEGTYYAVTEPSWGDLAKETKEDILQKALADGAKKGYKNVHIMNNDGKTVGLASQEKGIEILDF